MCAAVMPGLSVVVPVYGCTDCLRALHARLTATLDEMDVDWEIVYVDDCSPGESWPLLVGLAGGDPRVRAYHLSRNFGQSAAITAGLAHSEGERIVVMDCDLQDPPEAIPMLLAKAREGYEVVFTTGRAPSYGPARRLGTSAYWKLRTLVSGERQVRYSGFSLASRQAARAVVSMSDRHRSYLMMLRWLGLPHAAIEVPRNERYAGESSYTLRSLSRVALGNLFFQAAALLRRDKGRIMNRAKQRPPYVVDMETETDPDEGPHAGARAIAKLPGR